MRIIPNVTYNKQMPIQATNCNNPSSRNGSFTENEKPSSRCDL